MKLTVTVKPNCRQESVTLHADGSYLVKVNAPPTEGKANSRVVELLSEFFKRPKSSFTLISGHKNKKKVFTLS